MSGEVALLKKSLRDQMKQRLKVLSAENVTLQSGRIIERLSALPAWRSAKAVSCFISMQSGEVQTRGALERAKHVDDPKKKLFVPKVLGSKSVDMVMLAVESMEEIDQYPINKWGIPESPLDGPDATYDGIIDLVVVPGVAFDKFCYRVGHGKGYYDCFLSRINEENAKRKLPRPVTIGICFDEQIYSEAVPIEEHDLPLDYIVTPTTTYTAHQ